MLSVKKCKVGKLYRSYLYFFESKNQLAITLEKESRKLDEIMWKRKFKTCWIKLSSTIAGAPKLFPTSMKVGSPPVVKP